MHQNCGARPRLPRYRAALALLACVTASGVATSGAGATSTTYYASPSSTASSPCTAATPCRIDHAIAAASRAGDVVVLLPGTYAVTATVNTGRAITIEGAPGQSRPSLVGTQSLGGPTLNATGGATIRDLDIQATSTAGGHPPALSLSGGTAEDLTLSVASSDGRGAALAITPVGTPTIVRTVLATSAAAGGSAVALSGGGGGNTVSIDNLTAVAQTATTASVSNGIKAGTVTIKDSILTGLGAAVVASSDGAPIAISSSDFSPAGAAGYTDGGGNISVAPTFVDSSAGNYREDARSSTIDAGSPDANLSTTDLDGNPRTVGSAPDMGAYEYVAAGSAGGGSTGGSGGSTGGSGGSTGGSGGSTGGSGGSTGGAGGSTGGSGSSSGGLPAPATPLVGVSVTLRPASGRVEVELPGQRRFVALAAGSQLPVGTTIDATHGAVLLTSAVNRSGATKTGLFSGSRFVVRQAKAARAATRLQLAGGSFAACRAVVHGPMQGTTWVPRHHKVVRQLWGSDNGGSFTTIGRSASAAVRGTAWLTQDRCDGTLIRVLRGHVLVHDSVHHRNLLLGPGQSYLARARG